MEQNNYTETLNFPSELVSYSLFAGMIAINLVYFSIRFLA